MLFSVVVGVSTRSGLKLRPGSADAFTVGGPIWFRGTLLGRLQVKRLWEPNRKGFYQKNPLPIFARKMILGAMMILLPISSIR